MHTTQRAQFVTVDLGGGTTGNAGSPPHIPPPATAAAAPYAVKGAGCYDGDDGGLHWRLRDLSPRRVLRSLGVAYMTVLFTIPVLIAWLIINKWATPNVRYFSVYDSTLSYQYNADTIPAWLSVIVGFVALIATLVFAELCVARAANRTVNNGVARLLHFLLDGCCAWVVAMFFTELGKVLVGRYRPDWLARCQPADPAEGSSMDGVNVVFGQGAAANVACTNADSSQLTDGHKSFPSGHSSSSAVWAAYIAVYCAHQLSLWAACRAASPRYQRPNGSPRATCGGAFVVSLGLYWVLANIGWAFGVGISRITDNRHNPSDVVAGWAIGIVFGVVFAARAAAAARLVRPDVPQRGLPVVTGVAAR